PACDRPRARASRARRAPRGVRLRMRLRMIVSESVRSLTANLSTTVAATMTVLIGMFLLGLFIALGSWVVSWSNHVKRELVVHVYYCTTDTCAKEASPTQMNEVA